MTPDLLADYVLKVGVAVILVVVLALFIRGLFFD